MPDASEAGQTDLLKVNVVSQLHVLGVNPEDLKSTSWVGNSNVNLSIKSTESSKGGVDGVGSVGGSHDDNVGSGFKTIHKSKKLRDDSSLNLSVGLSSGGDSVSTSTHRQGRARKPTHLLSLGSDRVDLIDEDDGRTVLFGLLECLPEVALRLSSHLGHDLGSVDEEEEGTSLVGDGSSHECLSGTWRSEHEDTTGRLDTDRLKELRVSEGKLDE